MATYWKQECIGTWVQVQLMVFLQCLALHRAELFGIAAPNEFLFHFMKFHKIESMSKCVKVVDNQAAICKGEPNPTQAFLQMSIQ